MLTYAVFTNRLLLTCVCNMNACNPEKDLNMYLSIIIKMQILVIL